MKKVLFATTALVFSAGFAAAEVSISGNAVFGLGYSEDGLANGLSSELDPLKVDDMYTVYETYLTISGTTESDNGLSFGFETTIAAYNTDGGLEDDGSSVFVSGAFGKLSFGSVAEADEVATFSDSRWPRRSRVLTTLTEALTGDERRRSRVLAKTMPRTTSTTPTRLAPSPAPCRAVSVTKTTAMLWV